MADKTKTENTAITTVQPSGETRTATELVPAVLPMVPAVGTDKWKETLKRLLHLASPSELAQIASDPDVAELLTEIDEQVLPMRKLDKVAIVGFASHWNLAPFNDPSYEIWSLNEFYDVAKEQCSVAHSEGRLRWFEIHRREQSYEGNPFFLHSRNTNHAEKLAGMNCPVYMHKKWDDIKTSLAYPLRTIIAGFQFGGYLTNTISEMIALAIWEGFKEISIYGVDMAQEGEYCVAPETRVLTADLRWIPASEVQVGQKLMAFEEFPRTQNDLEGRYRQWKSATVEAAEQLTRPCVRLHMADGTTLVSSLEHRWLVHRCNIHAWQETQRLQSAEIYPQRCSKIVKLLNTWEEDKSWGAGYLAAAFDGEGYLSQKPHQHCASHLMKLGFSQKPNAMSLAVERELEARGFVWGRNESSEMFHYSLSGGRPETLRFLGQIRPERLLEKFDPDAIGIIQSMTNVPVARTEFIGEQPVIGLRTTTGTFVAEGFASHNSNQRPSCEYWIGVAVGRGIKVTLPEASDLMKTPYIYGWESHLIDAYHQKSETRLGELRQRRTHNEQVMQQARDAANQLLGAEENTRYMKAAYGGIRAGKPTT